MGDAMAIFGAKHKLSPGQDLAEAVCLCAGGILAADARCMLGYNDPPPPEAAHHSMAFPIIVPHASNACSSALCPGLANLHHSLRYLIFEQSALLDPGRCMIKKKIWLA